MRSLLIITALTAVVAWLVNYLLQRFVLAALVVMTLALSGCTPETVFMYAWCEIGDVAYEIEPNGDDLYLTLELLGVECDG